MLRPLHSHSSLIWESHNVQRGVGLFSLLLRLSRMLSAISSSSDVSPGPCWTTVAVIAFRCCENLPREIQHRRFVFRGSDAAISGVYSSQSMKHPLRGEVSRQQGTECGPVHIRYCLLSELGCTSPMRDLDPDTIPYLLAAGTSIHPVVT